VRKTLMSVSFVEGWAHYAEQLCVEEGFRADDPRFKAGVAIEALVRVTRLAVSVGLHSGTMTMDEAARRFEEDAHLRGPAARSEAARATFDPTYGRYTWGKLEILGLREKARAGWGADYSHQRFHKELLDLGAPPLGLMASGIGITPLFAMARHLNAAKASFELQYFTRSVRHTAFHEVLSAPEFLGKVNFHYAQDPESLRTYLHKLLRERPPGAHLYLCGPRPFMALVEDIAAAAWPPEAVHMEFFAADPLASSGPRTPFEVELARSRKTCTVPACSASRFRKSTAASARENLPRTWRIPASEPRRPGLPTPTRNRTKPSSAFTRRCSSRRWRCEDRHSRLRQDGADDRESGARVGARRRVHH